MFKPKAGECIPSTARLKQNNILGWDDYVETHKSETLTWHRKTQGQPHSGDVVAMRRINRARYHHAVKIIVIP